MGKASKRKKDLKEISTETTKTPAQKKKKATILNIEKSIKKEEIPKPEPSSSHLGSVKQFLGDHVKEIHSGIDPEKLTNFKKETKTILKGGAYFLTSIIFLIAILISVELHANNRIYAGTKAGTINLSYLEYDQARETLQKGVKDFFQQPVKFTLAGEVKEISLEELGVRASVDQTMAQLPVIKFEKTNPADLVASLFYERNVIPSYTLNGDQIEKILEAKFNLVDKRAKNARIVYMEDDFQIEAEKEGQAINREKLIDDMVQNIEGLTSNPIKLEIIKEEPRLTAEMLAQDKDRLVALIDSPLTLTYEDENMNINLLDHLDAINFDENTVARINGVPSPLPILLDDSVVKANASSPLKIQSNIQVGISADNLEEVLFENLISDIEVPTSPANLYTNEEGNVIIEGKGEDGRTIPREKLITAMELAVNSGLTEVPIPVNIEKAPLTISEDLQEKGIKDLIATGHSAYYGSPPNRMFNITYGTEKYNGLLIEPGVEFSFNDVLGPVDAGSGFKPEKVIKKDKLELEYGGGICQVSTTFYRAVLQAGLPITERKPHSWKVSYYSQSMGDGLDATIYPGVADLKFVNDTPSNLLIQSYTEGAEAYFKIYGTNDGRLVALDGPYGGGLTYRWNRTVKKDSEENTEEIWSRYRPIPPPEPKEKPKPIAQTETSAEANFNF